MLMLSKYNVTPDRCLKIFKHFGAQSVDTIKKNPYVLCEEGLISALKPQRILRRIWILISRASCVSLRGLSMYCAKIF